MPSHEKKVLRNSKIPYTIGLFILMLFVPQEGIAIHEWAHGCGWRHYGGKGVPFQEGYGGLTGISKGSYPLIYPIVSGTMVYDFRTKFYFSGRIIDAKSKRGIKGVKIYFIDTGFDDEASKAPRKHMKYIGQTVTEGTYIKSWDYFWGFEKGHEPKGTFELEFKKNNYITNNKKYIGSAFTSTGNNMYIDFGEIEMQKIK